MVLAPVQASWKQVTKESIAITPEIDPEGTWKIKSLVDW